MQDSFGMPIKWNGDDGDSMLWAGLMMAVGDSKPGQGIQMCQTPDGRMWRSPGRVNNQPKNSFSRDMALGFILYIQATGDYYMADKWVSYIKKEGALFPANESSDTRHIVTPALWWLISYAGIKVPAIYHYTRFLFNPYNKLELLFTPRGFQRHLKAVSALIMAIHRGKRDKFYGNFLCKKDPQNPFYLWLAGHSAFTIKAQLASHKADWIVAGGNGSQWAWERFDDESAWKDAMGQDFIFIDRLCELNID